MLSYYHVLEEAATRKNRKGARGVRFGHPVKKPPENFAALVRAWERGKLTFAEILERTDLKESTFYNRLREYRAAKGGK